MAKYSGKRLTGLSRSATNLSSNSEKVRLSDEVTLYDKQEYNGTFMECRFIGPIVHFQILWVPFVKEGGTVNRFPVMVGGRNPITGEVEDDSTPFHLFAKDRGLKIQHRLLVNIINRERQDEENHPGKRLMPSEQRPFRFPDEWGMGDQEFFIKDHSNRGSLTPVTVLDMTASMAANIVNLASLNKKRGSRDFYSVDDPEYGCDLAIKYDSAQKNPGDKWQINLCGDTVSPLTERDYQCLIYDITNLKSLEVPSIEEQEKEVERFYEKGMGFEKLDEAEDAKRRHTSVQNKRRRDDNDDSGVDWGDVTGDDEDESPKSGRSSRSRSRDAEDEDEAPRSHRSSNRSRPRDEDDEEEAPRSRTPRSRNRAEAEDEDDTPVHRKSTQRSRHSSVNDDDDGDTPQDVDDGDPVW